MYEGFTGCARKTMKLANQEAQRLNHERIGAEHVLMGLMREGVGAAANILNNLGVDRRKIRLEVQETLSSGSSTITTRMLPLTSCAKEVIAYSKEEAQNLNHDCVGTEHILLGLLREQETAVAQVLMNLGLTLEAVRAEILKLLGQPMHGPWNAARKPLDVQFSQQAWSSSRGRLPAWTTWPKYDAGPCEFKGCDDEAAIHLTYAESRKFAGDEHLCARHARQELDPYVPRPDRCAGTPLVLDGAIQFDIDLIAVSDIHFWHVLYLCEVGGERWIPVPTDMSAASAFVRTLKSLPSPRPSTYDALGITVRALGGEVQRVIVTDSADGPYRAEVQINHGTDSVLVDLRPSDAFILAIAFDCPIFFADKLVDRLTDKGRIRSS